MDTQFGWSERSCVAYVFIVGGYVIYKHYQLQQKGQMHFASLTLEHVACARGGRGPLLLAGFRLVVAAYVLCTVYLMASTPVEHVGTVPVGGLTVLSTYTVWTYTLIGFYLLAAGLVSTATALGFKGNSTWSHYLCCALWVSFETMAAHAWVVTLVVWFVLLPMALTYFHTDGGLLSFLALSAHNLNTVFIMTEGVVNRLSMQPAHYIFCVYYAAAYVVFSWFWFLRDGVFWYFFIDWRSPLTPLGYSLLLAMIYGNFRLCRCAFSCAKRRCAAEFPDEENSPLKVWLQEK